MANLSGRFLCQPHPKLPCLLDPRLLTEGMRGCLAGYWFSLEGDSAGRRVKLNHYPVAVQVAGSAPLTLLALISDSDRIEIVVSATSKPHLVG